MLELQGKIVKSMQSLGVAVSCGFYRLGSRRTLPQTLQTYGIAAAFGALSPENSGAAFAEVCGSPGEALEVRKGLRRLWLYPLVMTNITMENQHLIGKTYFFNYFNGHFQ